MSFRAFTSTTGRRATATNPRSESVAARPQPQRRLQRALQGRWAVLTQAERKAGGGAGLPQDLDSSADLPGRLQQVPRRGLGLAGVLLLSGSGAERAAAAGNGGGRELKEYADADDAFRLLVPADWEMGVPQEPYDRYRAGTSSRRTLVWYPPAEGTAVNVAAVITTPGADYTVLGSFGSAADFGHNLVQSMDRSYLLRAGRRASDPSVMVARLVAAGSDGGSYNIEYTTKRGDEAQRHLWSRVALGSNGRVRRFYTLTATCPEEAAGDVGATLRGVLASFELTQQV